MPLQDHSSQHSSSHYGSSLHIETCLKLGVFCVLLGKLLLIINWVLMVFFL